MIPISHQLDQKAQEWLSTQESFSQDLPWVFHDLSASDYRLLRDSKISVYSGKVRLMLSKEGDDTMQMLHTDRLSAFDCFVGYVPLKGAILCGFSEYWFMLLSSWNIPHHFLKRLNERNILVKKSKPLGFELVVRGYLAGSLLRDYLKGARLLYGVTLPDGLKPHQKLPHPLITPTTKAAVFEHDLPITPKEIVSKGICTQKQWDLSQDIALTLYKKSHEYLLGKGFILADTKYEVGLDIDNNVHVIDEVHTPDSSRFWDLASYETLCSQSLAPQMYDKENVRQWLIAQGFSGQGSVPTIPRAELLKLAKVYCDTAARIDCPLNIEGLNTTRELFFA